MLNTVLHKEGCTNIRIKIEKKISLININIKNYNLIIQQLNILIMNIFHNFMTIQSTKFTTNKLQITTLN